MSSSAVNRWFSFRSLAASFASGLAGAAPVSEIRIDYGPGYRVYYVQEGQRLILLLCGGDKSTQSDDIKTAHRIADQWRRQGADT